MLIIIIIIITIIIRRRRTVIIIIIISFLFLKCDTLVLLGSMSFFLFFYSSIQMTHSRT